MNIERIKRAIDRSAGEPMHGVPSDIAYLAYQAPNMVAEIERLRAWKNEILRVESSWDEQAVARLLGLPLGKPIRRRIQPAVEGLQSSLKFVTGEYDKLVDWQDKVKRGEQSKEIERLEYEAAWIRRKLDLPPETKLLSGNQSLAGKMHVVCSEAAGYERYIKSYKCDDKQGEIARQSVRIVEQEKEIKRLRAELAEAQKAGTPYAAERDAINAMVLENQRLEAELSDVKETAQYLTNRIEAEGGKGYAVHGLAKSLSKKASGP